jgi:hypothetical protein
MHTEWLHLNMLLQLWFMNLSQIHGFQCHQQTHAVPDSPSCTHGHLWHDKCQLVPCGCVLLQVEYWGVFPTRVLAVEAANAAWLAHNLGLDDGETLPRIDTSKDVERSNQV